MGLRRVLSVLSVVVVATGSLVTAAPKKGAPPAPAKGSASGSGSGSAPAPTPAPAAATDPAATPGGGSGSAVQMTEDTPPSDMNGTDENPDAPKSIGSETKVDATAKGPKRAPAYPIEEALRPITLLQNMSEVSIAPHAQFGDGSSIPYAGGDALRARYGITSDIQLGFTYVFAGIYPDPAAAESASMPTYNYGFHSGKAIGLDVTVRLQEWLAVKVGVPVYLSPVAVSIAAGAPIKFHFGDKYALGGLDDILNVRVNDKFAPDFYQEYNNARAEYELKSMTTQPYGHVRFSAYGIYQAKPDVAVIGRGGIDIGLSANSSAMAGNASGTGGGTTTYLRGGVQWSPRKFVDLGASLGFDDLAHIGSFGPAGFLALRI
jgi:hypothetical protein